MGDKGTSDYPPSYPPNYGSNDREPLYPTAPPAYDATYQNPPQQYGYPPPAPPSNGKSGVPVSNTCFRSTVTTATIIIPADLGATSRYLVCPSCTAQITTTVTYDSGLLTWLACVGLIFIGLGWGCCLIPFCVNSCKDATHNCPNCGAFIGRYKPL